MNEDDPQSRSLIARLVHAFQGTNGSGDTEPTLLTQPQANSALLANARAFERLRVADVMVPRADIIAVEVETSLSDLAAKFAEAAHSRLPIFRETLDDPIGMAHIKDIIAYLAGPDAGDRPSWEDKRILTEIRRPLLYAPPSMPAADLLLRMQSRHMHMALVVDEFGGTDGLVTLEDLLEPIVGDIEDEHDEDQAPPVLARGEDCWEADARASIVEFEGIVGKDVATDEEEEDVDTLGGLVFMLAGRIPERGEVITHPRGFEFEILESDPRRIKKIRIRQFEPDTSVPDMAGK